MRRATPRPALTFDVLEVAAQDRDAALDAPAIDLELGFAGTAGADTTAEAREIRADTDQIRLAIAQLRELDLKLALTAAGVARKDVQNQHRAIDDRHGDHLFEVLSLTRAQIVEHEDEIRFVFFHQIGDLARLAGADQRRRVDVIAPLNDARDDLRTGCLRERFEFYEFGFEWSVGVVGVDSDDKRSISQRSPSL